jgi:hypothetical protein
MILVPHDVVEPKTGTKKKLVMQLDRDVQVWNIFCCFSMYSLVEILHLLFEDRSIRGPVDGRSYL